MLADTSFARVVAPARGRTDVRVAVIVLLILFVTSGFGGMAHTALASAGPAGMTTVLSSSTGHPLTTGLVPKSPHLHSTLPSGMFNRGSVHPSGGARPGPITGPPPALPTVATLSIANDTLFQGQVSVPTLSFGVGIAYVPSSHFYYVADLAGSVLAVDPASGRLVTNISVGSTPSDIAFDPLNRLLYVTNSLTDRVEIVDPATNGLGPSIALPTGSGPSALAYDAVTHYLYIADYGNHSLSVVDPFTRVAIGHVQVGAGPVALAVDPTGGRVFVANSLSNNVSIVNATTFSVIGSVGVGSQPSSLAFVPTSNEVWVSNYNSSNLTVLDARHGSSLLSLALPHGSFPQMVLYDAGRNTIYVSGVGTYGVRVFNASTQSIDANVETNISASALAYAPDRNEVAVLNSFLSVAGTGSPNITLVNDIVESSVGSVSMGAVPNLTIYDNSTGFVYVSDLLTPVIYVLDQRTDQLVTTFALPRPASALALDPTGAVLWVGNGQDSNVLKLNATSGSILSTAALGFTGGVGGFLTVGSQVFVSELMGNVLALDAATWSPGATMPAGAYPTWMVADPPANAVYVMNAHGQNLTVLRSSTDTVVGSVPLGLASPTGLAYDPLSGGRIIVSVGALGVVDVINGGTLSVGLSLTPFQAPGPMVYLSATQDLYISSQGNASLAVVNGTSFATLGWAVTGASPGTLDFSPFSGKLYVSNMAGGTISVLGAAPAIGQPPFGAWTTVFPASVEVGQAMSIVVSSTLRPWQLSYVYNQLPAGCAAVNSAHLLCVPSASGVFTTHLAVTGNSQTVTLTLTLTVLPRMGATIRASPALLTLGSSTTISVVTANATGSVHSGWVAVPAGCQPPARAATFACVPTATGTYTFEALAYDALNAWSETNLTISVNPVPTITSFNASSTSTEKGGTITLTVVVAGGTAPFRYSYSGLPGGCVTANSMTLTCTPTQTGTFHVIATVNDSGGFSSKSVLAITVTAKSTSGSFLGLPLLDWVILLVLIVVVVVVIILLATRRRRAETPGAEGEAGGPTAEDESTYGEPESPTSSLPPLDIQPSPELNSPAPMPPPKPEAPSPPPVVIRAPPPTPIVAPPPVSPPPVSAPTTPTMPASNVPRQVAAPTRTPKVRSAAPASGPAPGSTRAPLKCSNCGTMNEPWLTNCRWCKRPLAST